MSERRYYSLSASSLYKDENYASLACIKNTRIYKASNFSPDTNFFGSPKLDGHPFVISVEDYLQSSYKLIKIYVDGRHSDFVYRDDDWTVSIPRCFVSNCDDMIVMPIKVVRKNGIVNYYRYHILSQGHRYRGGINNADLHTAQCLSILISSMMYQFSDGWFWRDRNDMKALWETYTVYRYGKTESEYNNMLR